MDTGIEYSLSHSLCSAIDMKVEGKKFAALEEEEKGRILSLQDRGRSDPGSVFSSVEGEGITAAF